MWKVGQNSPFFQMSAILKFDFQKSKQLRFSEVNYLNYASLTELGLGVRVRVGIGVRVRVRVRYGEGDRDR